MIGVLPKAHPQKGCVKVRFEKRKRGDPSPILDPKQFRKANGEVAKTTKIKKDRGLGTETKKQDKGKKNACKNTQEKKLRIDKKTTRRGLLLKKKTLKETPLRPRPRQSRAKDYKKNEHIPAPPAAKPLNCTLRGEGFPGLLRRNAGGGHKDEELFQRAR